MLPQHQPVQDIERLSMRLKALLHQGRQLDVVFEFLIGTIGVHEVHRIVEGLPYALVVAQGIQVLAQARVNVAEPHAQKEGPIDDQLPLHSEQSIFLYKVPHEAMDRLTEP